MHGGENLPEDAGALHPIIHRSQQWLISRRLPRRGSAFIRDRRLHEFLWYCVPGVLVALVLRAALMVSMPFGYYHPDTHDFMATAYSVITNHHWAVHGKTTFLTPTLYLLAFFPKVPALFVIPLAQHARGLLMVLMIGALARLWFRRWRWWIVPVTVLAAMQPSVIFWEQTLTSESGFVFCAVLLALAGTLFARWPSRVSFGLLLFAMCCVAAARPEGNLWQGAGVLLVLIVYGRRWKREWIKIMGTVLVALGMLAITKTSHSGLLLYSSLVQFTPDNPTTVPGFGPYILPTRDRLRSEREERVGDDVVKASRPVQQALLAYIADHPHADLGLDHAKPKKRKRHTPVTAETAAQGSALDLRYSNNMSNLCRQLAVESASHHVRELPGYAWRKFLARIRDDPGGRFDEYTFDEKQAVSLAGKPAISQALGRRLTGGVPIDDLAEAQAFVDAHYHLGNLAWFNALEARWQAAVDRWHLPDTRYSAEYVLPGLTWFHLLGMVGALVALGRPGPARRLHWAFVPTMAGAWFLVMLTAAVIPRHRFVWEPFWLLYGFLLLDSVAAGVRGVMRQRSLRDEERQPEMRTAVPVAS